MNNKAKCSACGSGSWGVGTVKQTSETRIEYGSLERLNLSSV